MYFRCSLKAVASRAGVSGYIVRGKANSQDEFISQVQQKFQMMLIVKCEQIEPSALEKMIMLARGLEITNDVTFDANDDAYDVITKELVM